MPEDRRPLAELLQKSGDGDFLQFVVEAVLQIPLDEGVPGAAQAEIWMKANIYRPLFGSGSTSDPSWAIATTSGDL